MVSYCQWSVEAISALKIKIQPSLFGLLCRKKSWVSQVWKEFEKRLERRAGISCNSSSSLNIFPDNVEGDFNVKRAESQHSSHSYLLFLPRSFFPRWKKGISAMPLCFGYKKKKLEMKAQHVQKWCGQGHKGWTYWSICWWSTHSLVPIIVSLHVIKP